MRKKIGLFLCFSILLTGCQGFETTPSSITWQCLMHCGLYSGPYTTSAGWRGLGSPVSSLTDAQAGDIICYQGHVAIYDGNGMIVEAKGSKWGITHDRAANCRPILAIRRFTTD